MRDPYVWIDPWAEIEWWEDTVRDVRERRDETIERLREQHHWETIGLKKHNEHLTKAIYDIAATTPIFPILVKDPKAND